MNALTSIVKPDSLRKKLKEVRMSSDNESLIELPPDHDPELCEALQMMEMQRKTGWNFLNIVTEIRHDLVRMNLTQKEIDLFELGVYTNMIMNRQQLNYIKTNLDMIKKYTEEHPNVEDKENNPKDNET